MWHGMNIYSSWLPYYLSLFLLHNEKFTMCIIKYIYLLSFLSFHFQFGLNFIQFYSSHKARNWMNWNKGKAIGKWREGCIVVHIMCICMSGWKWWVDFIANIVDGFTFRKQKKIECRIFLKKFHLIFILFEFFELNFLFECALFSG